MTDERDHDVPGEGSHSRSSGLPTGFSATFSSLAVPNFRKLWFGMLFSIAAMQINLVARSWLAYHLSGSALTLGIVAVARGLPSITLSPLGGVVADRFDKRKVLILSQSGLCVLSLVNAVLVHLGIIQIWHLVVIGIFQGIVFPFTMPARQAYIPELVDKGDLANALAMDSTGRNLNRVVAPSVAGLLIAWHPIVAFYAVAVFYFGSALTLTRLPYPRFLASGHESALQQMMAGFRYLVGHPVVMPLMVMSFLAVVLGMPFQQLLPVFQVEVLHVGPAQLGFMYGAVGIGALFGSLIVAYLSGHPRKGQIQIIAGVGFGISLLLFAVSGTYWISLVFLVIVGATSQGYLTLNRMLILLNTNRDLYGRVMGIYMMTWSLMPIATLPMGALVDEVGAAVTVAGGGALLCVLIVILFLTQPGIRHLGKKRDLSDN